MGLNRYELQSKHAGQIWLAVAVYAWTDEEAIKDVAEAANAALKGGAVDLALFQIGLGFEREVKRYIGGEAA